MIDPEDVHFAFGGELWYWRGPAPYHFVTVPDAECAMLKRLSPTVTYGWGMIPIKGRIGATEFETSLWPKDGRYVVPIRDVVRKAELLTLGDVVEVELRIRSSPIRRAKADDAPEFDMDHGPADV